MNEYIYIYIYIYIYMYTRISDNQLHQAHYTALGRYVSKKKVKRTLVQGLSAVRPMGGVEV